MPRVGCETRSVGESVLKEHDRRVRRPARDLELTFDWLSYEDQRPRIFATISWAMLLGTAWYSLNCLV